MSGTALCSDMVHTVTNKYVYLDGIIWNNTRMLRDRIYRRLFLLSAVEFYERHGFA